MTDSSQSTHFGVKVYFSGQIGNQFFHYGLGKILAEKRGLDFVPPEHFVDKNNNPVKWSGAPLFTMRRTVGMRHMTKAIQFGAYHWYDFDALPTGHPLHICYGHWCRYELFREWKDRIKNDWLAIPADRFIETDPDALYIHVRRTDFTDDFAGTIDTNFQSSATTIEQFAACLEVAGSYRKLILVTDAPRDPFLDGFKVFGVPVEIVSNVWDQDFLLLASCRQLIMSNSTFSWWAGFLGKAERIICPLFPDTYWGRGAGARGPEREQYPNLCVDDEPERWDYVTL